MNELLKVCKVAGHLLKPHIPLVVAILLEALSSLEPQGKVSASIEAQLLFVCLIICAAFNYLAFHVDKQEALEVPAIYLALLVQSSYLSNRMQG